MKGEVKLPSNDVDEPIAVGVIEAPRSLSCIRDTTACAFKRLYCAVAVAVCEALLAVDIGAAAGRGEAKNGW
jgi:hypothetical protein